MAMQSATGHPQFEIPYGPTVPAFYALLARAHMDRYGTTSEQLAAVAVSARSYASQRPGAQMTESITVSDVLESRMIADPLHLLDCSLVSDGGAAVILTSAGNAGNFRNKPVYLLGMGEGHSHEHISQARSLTTSAAVQSGGEAYAMAGLTPTDIDLAQIYDCFTPVVLIELEDLGFCQKGEGGPFIESGASALDGELPMNTNGGLLSYCHPGNPGSGRYTTRQLRWCTDRAASCPAMPRSYSVRSNCCEQTYREIPAGTDSVHPALLGRLQAS